MPSVVLLVDCDNQPASCVDRLIDAVHSSTGVVACVFLAGNNSGKQVQLWDVAIKKHLPTAIVDSIISDNRKDSADAHLIRKTILLESLFQKSGVKFVFVTADKRILAAAEILAQSGHHVLFANIHLNRLTPSFLPHIEMNEGKINDKKKAAESCVQSIPTNQSPVVKKNRSASDWLLLVLHHCKQECANNKKYLLRTNVHLALVKMGVNLKKERNRIIRSLPLDRSHKGYRLYLPSQ